MRIVAVMAATTFCRWAPGRTKPVGDQVVGSPCRVSVAAWPIRDTDVGGSMSVSRTASGWRPRSIHCRNPVGQSAL